jgi:hypothetical protein
VKVGQIFDIAILREEKSLGYESIFATVFLTQENADFNGRGFRFSWRHLASPH